MINKNSFCDKMSTFQQIRMNMRERLGITKKEEESSNEDVQNSSGGDEAMSKEEKDASQNEHGFQKVLRAAIKKFHERGIIGSIEIYSQFGMFSNIVSCDVDEDSHEIEEEIENESDTEEKMRMVDKFAIGAIDTLIRRLEMRAKVYRNKPLAKSVTLSNGMSISDPLLGAFSCSVTISATVLSLFNSIAQREFEHLQNS